VIVSTSPFLSVARNTDLGSEVVRVRPVPSGVRSVEVVLSVSALVRNYKTAELLHILLVNVAVSVLDATESVNEVEVLVLVEVSPPVPLPMTPSEVFKTELVVVGKAGVLVMRVGR
jgi:hypothetical protein